MPIDDQILGHGVYTPNEAARLLQTNPQQIIRWTHGGGSRAPLWHSYYQFLEDSTELSFIDLIEVRVVLALRNAGISLQAIRFAISFAQEKFGIERPLSSQSFKTDGEEILIDAVEKDGELVSLSRPSAGQKVFRTIVAQSLNDLEYDGDAVARWRPKGHETVVIDPQRSFGEPLLDDFGISTGVIFKEYKEFRDVGYISSIYEIPAAVVRKGLRFEGSLETDNG